MPATISRRIGPWPKRKTSSGRPSTLWPITTGPTMKGVAEGRGRRVAASVEGGGGVVLGTGGGGAVVAENHGADKEGGGGGWGATGSCKCGGGGGGGAGDRGGRGSPGRRQRALAVISCGAHAQQALRARGPAGAQGEKRQHPPQRVAVAPLGLPACFPVQSHPR